MTHIDEKNKTESMVPPWIECPDYGPYSMGWRMGDGEDYIDDWHKFIAALNEKEFKEYFEKYNIPEEWTIIHRPLQFVKLKGACREKKK